MPLDARALVRPCPSIFLLRVRGGFVYLRDAAGCDPLMLLEGTLLPSNFYSDADDLFLSLVAPILEGSPAWGFLLQF